MRHRAEDRAAELALINRALSGGEGYRELAKNLQAEITSYSDDT